MIADELLRTTEGLLARLSAYDPLTVLANRRTLRLHVENAALEGGFAVASLLFLDLDRFKSINDCLGHAAGDEVLIQVAERLRRLTPEGAVAGRLGGDEFVIFWPGSSPKQAEHLAQSLLRSIAEPFVARGQMRQASASIGVASCDIADRERLMREADEAMSAAKRQGGARVVVFDTALHARLSGMALMEQELAQALDGDQLQIHYQPLVTAPGRVVCGFEALARWRHPERGWIAPSDFISQAEDTGLIIRIGAWVLAGAVRQIARWREAHGDLTMSINVADHQLADGALCDLLADLLAAEGVPAQAICIEVTEGTLLHDASVDELGKLRELGVSIAIDDFGTGYSSLSYLRTLPVDIVKIDRSFITSLGSNARADHVFFAIIDLAHTLGLTSVAEGCETQLQWDVISASGCEMVQGWLVSKAGDAATIGEFLRAG